MTADFIPTVEIAFSHTASPVDPPLSFRYLNFDTPLPEPRPSRDGIGEKQDSRQMLPERPNLRGLGNPFDWPESRKSVLLWISTVATAFTAYSSGMYASGVSQMSDEWHVSHSAVLVGITTFTIGFGIAPMVLAPFSELTGRRPVFVVTGILWVLFQILCAVTRSYVGMLLARLAAGIASSTFSTMVGGVIADMYRKADRNTPMTIFTGGVLFGTGLGPLVSGFIAEHLSWRWIFWVHVMAIAGIMLMVVFFFYESRGSVILSRRARTLNEWYERCEQVGFSSFDVYERSASAVSSGASHSCQRLRWKVKTDEERTGLAHMMKISLLRPIKLLFTEPVVFFFSLWIMFAWGILYLMFSAIPLVYETVYRFSLQQSGAVFSSVSIASIIFTIVSIYQDRFSARFFGVVTGTAPEDRLRFACLWSALLPISLFIFGWTSSPTIPWIVPTIFGIALATAGIFSIYLATFNYLADCYHTQASSAIACQSMCRNLFGGAVPIFTEAMFNKLTIGGASSLLGGIAAILTLVPWVLAFYGPEIRSRSKVASKFMQ